MKEIEIIEWFKDSAIVDVLGERFAVSLRLAEMLDRVLSKYKNASFYIRK